MDQSTFNEWKRFWRFIRITKSNPIGHRLLTVGREFTRLLRRFGSLAERGASDIHWAHFRDTETGSCRGEMPYILPLFTTFI